MYKTEDFMATNHINFFGADFSADPFSYSAAFSPQDIHRYNPVLLFDNVFRSCDKNVSKILLHHMQTEKDWLSVLSLVLLDSFNWRSRIVNR